MDASGDALRGIEHARRVLGNAAGIDLVWLRVHADGGNCATIMAVHGRADLRYLRGL